VVAAGMEVGGFRGIDRDRGYGGWRCPWPGGERGHQDRNSRGIKREHENTLWMIPSLRFTTVPDGDLVPSPRWI
jgi:hypothetical protein